MTPIFAAIFSSGRDHDAFKAKISIKVLLPSDGQKVCAITYIANPKKIREGLKPRRCYLEYLLAGEDFLSASYLKWLQETETLD